jgi:hypothetical protein
MAYATWDQIFTGNDQRILKAQYGSILVRDYAGPATALTTYSPFDPTTGHLSTTLTTTDGWVECGLTDENGIQFTPKYTTVDVMAWQSRQVQRTDVTLDTEDFMFTLIESTPLTDALTYHIPLSQMQATGTQGYSITKSTTPNLLSRQVLALGVDYNSGTAEYFAIGFSLVKMVKPDKFDYSDKNPIATALNWASYIDPSTGWAVKRWREGPAWRASGGTTTPPGTPAAVAVTGAKATLTFSPPTSLDTPFTYQVKQTVSSVTSVVPTGQVVVTSSSPTSVVLTVSGLTAASSYTFAVAATGSNGTQSTYSTASSSITAIA